MNLLELSDIVEQDIVLRRYKRQGTRWTAKLEGAEVIEPGNPAVLVGGYGDGDSPKIAMENYVKSIRGARLVFHAMDKERRREYGVPHTLSAT